MKVKNKLSSAHQVALHLCFSLALQYWQCLQNVQAIYQVTSMNRVPTHTNLPWTHCIRWKNVGSTNVVYSTRNLKKLRTYTYPLLGEPSWLSLVPNKECRKMASPSAVFEMHQFFQVLPMISPKFRTIESQRSLYIVIRDNDKETKIKNQSMSC